MPIGNLFCIPTSYLSIHKYNQNFFLIFFGNPKIFLDMQRSEVMIRYTCGARQGKPAGAWPDLAIRFRCLQLFDFLFWGWVIVVVGMGIPPLGEFVRWGSAWVGMGRHGSATQPYPHMVSRVKTSRYYPHMWPFPLGGTPLVPNPLGRGREGEGNPPTPYQIATTCII